MLKLLRQGGFHPQILNGKGAQVIPYFKRNWIAFLLELNCLSNGNWIALLMEPFLLPGNLTDEMCIASWKGWNLSASRYRFSSRWSTTALPVRQFPNENFLWWEMFDAPPVCICIDLWKWIRLWWGPLSWRDILAEKKHTFWLIFA